MHMPIDYFYSSKTSGVTSTTTSITRRCWYCEQQCYTFVSICNNCTYKREVNKTKKIKEKQQSIKI